VSSTLAICARAAAHQPRHASQVPLWAEYRLAVTLQPVSNAVVLDAASAANGTQQVALHVFGVAQGTCPPGTYLKPRPGCADGSIWRFSFVFAFQLPIVQPQHVTTDDVECLCSWVGMTSLVKSFKPGKAKTDSLAVKSTPRRRLSQSGHARGLRQRPSVEQLIHIVSRYTRLLASTQCTLDSAKCLQPPFISSQFLCQDRYIFRTVRDSIPG